MIQPSDFLARRTAVLGMTRTGKSNTVKTTVASVAIAAQTDGIKIGQIIFDINGEYANANHQDDGSSIADVFGSDCIRYRAIDTPGFEDLYENAVIPVALAHRHASISLAPGGKVLDLVTRHGLGMA